MKVSYFATLRQIVGQKTIEFDVPPGSTVGFLVKDMVTRYPDLGRALLDSEGQLARHVHVFVNGRDVPYLENQMNTVLQENDAVSVFPAVGGG